MLAAVVWRLCPAERTYAWPWPGPWPSSAPALVAIAWAAAGAALAVAWWRRPEADERRALVALALWPAGPLALAWSVLPASGLPNAGAAVALAASAGAGWALARGAQARAALGRGRRGWLEGKIWIGCHAAALAGIAAAGLWTGSLAAPGSFLLSLALYPLYALVQLYLLLAIPWPWLRALSAGRRRAATAAAACLFALAHWPNPVVMALCAIGMSVWAREYDRGRGLVPLALSMGVLATLVTQNLPDRWTEHMRVGPGCVRLRAVPALAAGAAERTIHLPAGKPRTQAFLADLYPGIAGRSPAPAELDRWWLSLTACRRGVLAWSFFISEEYHRKFGSPAGEPPLPGNTHWTQLPDPWPARIGAFTEPDPALPPDEWDGFLQRLYREILHRTSTAGERAAWSVDLSPRQQQRLVEVLLERRLELGRAPFDTLDCRAMRLHD
ncbi:MAG TPA: hypothetical protein PLL30_12315 [Candidatus Krumholzibacteria bacterium]|nr:hypothetical protein [Candidatus Krumholzibacteria bacterium]HRY40516.1 hypothetical protein [Candidatus Krumholzibacteria bacterium]